VIVESRNNTLIVELIFESCNRYRRTACSAFASSAKLTNTTPNCSYPWSFVLSLRTMHSMMQSSRVPFLSICSVEDSWNLSSQNAS